MIFKAHWKVALIFICKERIELEKLPSTAFNTANYAALNKPFVEEVV